MLAFVRWLMQDTKRSVAIVFVTMLMPLLFWLSCALCALNLMRKGWAASSSVLLAAILASLVWFHFAQPVPLVCLGISLVMAEILRNKASWIWALIGAALITTVLSQFQWLVTLKMLPTQLLSNLQQQPALMLQLDSLQQKLALTLPQLWLLLFNFGVGILVVLIAIASVALARSWQASLYNPGGFREEFHALRYPPRVTLCLLLISIVGAYAGFWMAPMLLLIPLLIAGIALIHGVIGLTHKSKAWLVLLYVGLLFFQQIVILIILLALLDSFFDFRRLIAKRLSH